MRPRKKTPLETLVIQIHDGSENVKPLTDFWAGWSDEEIKLYCNLPGEDIRDVDQVRRK